MLGAGAKVHSGRAELLQQAFDCVTLRAVDRMELAVQQASRLVSPGGWLALMTTDTQLEKLKEAAGAEFSWTEPARIVGGGERMLALGKRAVSSPA